VDEIKTVSKGSAAEVFVVICRRSSYRHVADADCPRPRKDALLTVAAGALLVIDKFAGTIHKR